MQQTSSATSDAIHLSVVATSRNDNHGGSLTRRMQHFIDGFVTQCKRHGLRAELILVEWNPPSDRVPLAQELRWPVDTGPCDIRIITVPPEVHRTFDHADKLPLFQMTAKNVGIRRACGKFVLSTNIDILFSDESMSYMRDRLKEGVLYRNDRLDVPNDVPDESDFSNTIRWCWEKYFRINANGRTVVKTNGRWQFLDTRNAYLHPGLRWLLENTVKFIADAPAKAVQGVKNRFGSLIQRGHGQLLQPSGGMLGHRLARLPIDVAQRVCVSLVSVPFSAARLVVDTVFQAVPFVSTRIRHAFQQLRGPWLFTNACGDFTLLSRADWHELHGHAEWAMYSFHLDSILLHQARAAGIRERYMGKRAAVFHIEHQPGSGFTPEDPSKLFDRLKVNGIPYLDWNDDVIPIIDRMNEHTAGKSAKSYQLAGPNWGLAGLHLTETRIGATA